MGMSWQFVFYDVADDAHVTSAAFLRTLGFLPVRRDFRFVWRDERLDTDTVTWSTIDEAVARDEHFDLAVQWGLERNGVEVWVDCGGARIDSVNYWFFEISDRRLPDFAPALGEDVPSLSHFLVALSKQVGAGLFIVLFEGDVSDVLTMHRVDRIGPWLSGLDALSMIGGAPALMAGLRFEHRLVVDDMEVSTTWPSFVDGWSPF